MHCDNAIFRYVDPDQPHHSWSALSLEATLDMPWNLADEDIRIGFHQQRHMSEHCSHNPAFITDHLLHLAPIIIFSSKLNLPSQVAIHQEVLVAVCGADGALANGIITVWGQAVRQAKISNVVIAALEPNCQRAAEALGMPAFQAGLQVGFLLIWPAC